VTSNINFAAINENFPVAGQDNDTQTFRDNFDTIKTNFSSAKTEITDLQDNAARTDEDNDFLYNVVGSLTLQDAYLRKKDYGAAIVTGTQDISFKQAMYHVVKVGANTSLSFSEFPTGVVDIAGLGQIGKATLELYGDGTPVVNAGSFVPGTIYTINSVGSTNFTAIGASSNTVGTIFTASGAGSGSGNAITNRILSFTLSGGTQLRKSNNFPTTLTVGSTSNPVIIEVWQHSATVIFLNYLGTYN
jgi:hypothetical protein